MFIKTRLFTSLIVILSATAFAQEQGTIIGWGSNVNATDSSEYFGQATPPDGNDFTAIDAGLYHSIALTSDGSIIAWGDDYYNQVSRTPSGTDFIAIVAGDGHNVAIRTDRSLESWGDDYYYQVTDTPTGNDFIAIAAGQYHSVALRSNGTVVVGGMTGMTKSPTLRPAAISSALPLAATIVWQSPQKREPRKAPSRPGEGIPLARQTLRLGMTLSRSRPDTTTVWLCGPMAVWLPGAVTMGIHWAISAKCPIHLRTMISWPSHPGVIIML
jgi:hypothetical protein